MTCKRSEQCDNADICQYAKSNAYDILGGSCYRPKDPQTNEEWLKSCDTEQLAEWMVMLQLVGVYPIKRGSVDTEMFIADTVEWLKQPHKE